MLRENKYRIVEKKRKWATMPTVGDMLQTTNGDIHGYDLLPPFSEFEVALACELKGIRLPLDIINYLTQISREFFIYGRPHVFRLEDLPSHDQIVDAFIPTEYKHLYNLPSDDLDYNAIACAMVKIGYDHYVYCGAGSAFGAIFTTGEEGEGEWYRTGFSLDELINL